MLPEPYALSRWGKSCLSIKNSPTYVVLNLGFKGDIRSAGASSQNKWFLSSFDYDEEYLWDFMNSVKESTYLFVSFPSLKDPEHNSGNELMETGECVLFVAWDKFEQWKDTTPSSRPEEYLALKQRIEDKIYKQL